MKLNRDIPFLEKRMSFGGCVELDYLKDKYKNIFFDWQQYNRAHAPGKYLYAVEGFITVPNNYNVDFVKNHFKGLITPNSKFKTTFQRDMEIYVVNGPGNYNNYWIPEQEDFVGFEKKIHGICAMNNIYHTGQPGDIVGIREPMFNSIDVENFTKHAYGPKPYGGENYRGYPETGTPYLSSVPGGPSSPGNLETIAKYKFCLCLEPMYHEMWSHDWVTERLFNCLKMKTIPLYYGCYNIEDKIPEESFIDLRKFDNINEAILSIKDIGEEEYNRITDASYEFHNDCKIGYIPDIEKVLKYLN